MDCAKAVGARVVYPNRSLDQLKGLLRVWRRLPLLIAIPTTAPWTSRKHCCESSADSRS